MANKYQLKPYLFLLNKGFLFFVILCFFISSCEGKYQEGYSSGYRDGEAAGYSKGLKEGYEKGNRDAMRYLAGKESKLINTIDGVLFSSRGTTIMFWIFCVLNMIALISASIYLVARVKILSVQIGKILVYVVSAYLWFRIIQFLLLSNNIPGAKSNDLIQGIIEFGVFIAAILLCFGFDQLYVKTEPGNVWIDCIGISFCTILFLQLAHYLINWELLLSLGGPTYVLNLVGVFSIGGITYSIYALLSRFVKNRFQERPASKNRPKD